MRKIILFSLLFIGIGSNATAAEMECEIIFAKQKWVWDGEELFLSTFSEFGDELDVKMYPSADSNVKVDIQTSDGLPVFEISSEGWESTLSFIDKTIKMTAPDDAPLPINGTFPCK